MRRAPDVNVRLLATYFALCTCWSESTEVKKGTMCAACSGQFPYTVTGPRHHLDLSNRLWVDQAHGSPGKPIHWPAYFASKCLEKSGAMRVPMSPKSHGQRTWMASALRMYSA